jgi:hypothetical protein
VDSEKGRDISIAVSIMKVEKATVVNAMKVEKVMTVDLRAEKDLVEEAGKVMAEKAMADVAK